MKRGEIWWASLPDPAGSGPGYRRPVLVIQADAFNRSAIRTVICVALSSNLRLAAAPGNVRVGVRASGLSKPSVVNVSQVVALDRAFLTERVKSLGLDTMAKVDIGLRLAMSL